MATLAFPCLLSLLYALYSGLMRFIAVIFAVKTAPGSRLSESLDSTP
jgi:hypothetical protein